MAEVSSSQELASELAALRQRVSELEAEVQLQKYLRTTLDHLPYRVWLKGINGNYLAVNRHFCQETGTNIQAVLGKTDADLWESIDAERFRQEDLEMISAQAQSMVLEEMVTTVDGGQQWFSTIKTLVYNPTGELLGLAGVSFDITDRKNAEIALENLKNELETRVWERTAALEQEVEQRSQSEQRLRDISEAAGEYIWELDAQGKYIFVTEKVKLVKGYSPSELLGRSPLEFMPPEDVALVLTILEQAAAQKSSFRLEHRDILPNGEIVWEEVNGLPILDAQGEIIGFRGAGLSITDRKQAEMKLQQTNAQLEMKVQERTASLRQIMKDLAASEATLQEAQQMAHLGSWRLDALTQEVSWSDEMFRIFGMNPGQPAPSIEERQKDIHPEDLTAWKAAIDEAMHHNCPYEIEFRYFRGGEHLRYLRGSGRPIANEQGEVVRLIGTVLDITDRKQAELALQQANEALELRVEVRTRELQETVADLENTLQELKLAQSRLIQSEKMSSLGQLVAGVAHEINNPVNFIYGNLNYASEYTDKLLKLLQTYQKSYPEPVTEVSQVAEDIDWEFVVEDMPKLINSMRVGAERIQKIVLSLRTFSRMDEADLKSVDIHEGIDSTLMILQHRLKAKQHYPAVQVVKKYADLPPVECYPGQLNQVFMNIISNAIDALEERDQRRSPAELLSHPSCIWITTEVRQTMVGIRIKDNGVGIPPQVLQRLFDPFYTTKDVGKGTGMGLSISYQIITDRHKGTLECISQPGAGAEFIIQIPS